MADKIEPVAFTCPHDPDSSSAFAWPGTARCSTSHTTPLYSQQQLDALVASEQEALDDTAKWHRIAMDMMERADRAEAEAAALREDAERLDALEALVNEQPDKMLVLHHGNNIGRGMAGLGLSNCNRDLRTAIDAARSTTTRGQEG